MYKTEPIPGKKERSSASDRNGQTKTQISIRLDDDVLNFFRGTGRFWQARVNAILRKYVKENL